MVTKAILEEIKNRLVTAYDPVAIYLFGSYAWGVPDDDSDLDILIVVEKSDEKSYKRPVRGYEALVGLGVSKDLIVHTKDEFDRSLANVHTLCAKVAKEGRLLYAKP